jgi:uncharacterized NAD-dependent epimerase/dehydratase family protein
MKTARGFERLAGIFTDDTGHGTGIASIIHKLVPHIELFSVRLASADRRLSEDLLTEAINYCLEFSDIRIINISMGIPTEAPSNSLLDACGRAERQNVLISAAAYKYPNTSCYPAHFPTVFGVSTGLVADKFEYGFCEGPINILAKGTTQRVATLDNGYKISSGTSFATAHFSGIAASILAKTPVTRMSEWRDLIRKGARVNIQPLIYFHADAPIPTLHQRSREEFDEKGLSLFTNRIKAGFGKDIAIYPASEKEMNTIVEFAEYCRFRIRALVDYPIRLIRQDPQKKRELDVIRDIGRIDFSAFDTVVCGYFLDQLADGNISFSIRFVKECLARNKNFICWDVDVSDLIQKLIRETGPSCTSAIEVVRVTNEMYRSIREYNNLPYLKTPVISIVGTSNKQGKITAQLRIRKILEEEGYKVSHVSTEPQGILFGADFCFPYGYKCPIEPPEHEWSRLMRIALRGIQQYNKPDIILTGTQGALLPRSRTISNEIGHDLSSLHFLLGVMPDAFCCAINPDDEPEFIYQTIEAINIWCKSKCLFCFMTPWSRTILTNSDSVQGLTRRRLLDRKEISEKLHFFERRLSLPVIDVMDAAQDRFILNAIQEAFSAPVMAVN